MSVTEMLRPPVIRRTAPRFINTYDEAVKREGHVLTILILVLACNLSIVKLWSQTSNLPTPDQVTPSPDSKPALAFLFVQRSEVHTKRSSSEVFLKVVDDLVEYLKSKNVALTPDGVGRPHHAEGVTPMETVFNLARDANATSVLYVVVDRPMTKWIKVTVKCMDMNGKLLWGEDVASKGITSSGGFRYVIGNLHTRLDARLGMPGLPLLTMPKPSELPTAKESRKAN